MNFRERQKYAKVYLSHANFFFNNFTMLNGIYIIGTTKYMSYGKQK